MSDSTITIEASRAMYHAERTKRIAAEDQLRASEAKHATLLAQFDLLFQRAEDFWNQMQALKKQLHGDHQDPISPASGRSSTQRALSKDTLDHDNAIFALPEKPTQPTATPNTSSKTDNQVAHVPSAQVQKKQDAATLDFRTIIAEAVDVEENDGNGTTLVKTFEAEVALDTRNDGSSAAVVHSILRYALPNESAFGSDFEHAAAGLPASDIAEAKMTVLIDATTAWRPNQLHFKSPIHYGVKLMNRLALLKASAAAVHQGPHVPVVYPPATALPAPVVTSTVLITTTTLAAPPVTAAAISTALVPFWALPSSTVPFQASGLVSTSLPKRKLRRFRETRCPKKRCSYALWFNLLPPRGPKRLDKPIRLRSNKCDLNKMDAIPTGQAITIPPHPIAHNGSSNCDSDMQDAADMPTNGPPGNSTSQLQQLSAGTSPGCILPKSEDVEMSENEPAPATITPANPSSSGVIQSVALSNSVGSTMTDTMLGNLSLGNTMGHFSHALSGPTPQNQPQSTGQNDGTGTSESGPDESSGATSCTPDSTGISEPLTLSMHDKPSSASDDLIAKELAKAPVEEPSVQEVSEVVEKEQAKSQTILPTVGSTAELVKWVRETFSDVATWNVARNLEYAGLHLLNINNNWDQLDPIFSASNPPTFKTLEPVCTFIQRSWWLAGQGQISFNEQLKGRRTIVLRHAVILSMRSSLKTRKDVYYDWDFDGNATNPLIWQVDFSTKDARTKLAGRVDACLESLKVLLPQDTSQVPVLRGVPMPSELHRQFHVAFRLHQLIELIVWVSDSKSDNGNALVGSIGECVEETKAALKEIGSHLPKDSNEREVYEVANKLSHELHCFFTDFDVKRLVCYIHEGIYAFSETEADSIKSKMAQALAPQEPSLLFSGSFTMIPLNSKGESAVAYAEVLRDIIAPLQNTLMNRRMWVDDIVIQDVTDQLRDVESNWHKVAGQLKRTEEKEEILSGISKLYECLDTGLIRAQAKQQCIDPMIDVTTIRRSMRSLVKSALEEQNVTLPGLYTPTEFTGTVNPMRMEIGQDVGQMAELAECVSSCLQMILDCLQAAETTGDLEEKETLKCAAGGLRHIIEAAYGAWRVLPDKGYAKIESLIGEKLEEISDGINEVRAEPGKDAETISMISCLRNRCDLVIRVFSRHESADILLDFLKDVDAVRRTPGQGWEAMTV
ncbi:hypothetical protein AOQ84DRAFT_369012 [Glonium stellatum]|uniref:Uncharacterized protein n=1 Tax=Glonium stellatum TaxID=574774 RepID=A0A8E2EPY0_9PEZI|nr:hypothetical protein AOQ84DRAFT_369012 [Glonium stellatum]